MNSMPDSTQSFAGLIAGVVISQTYTENNIQKNAWFKGEDGHNTMNAQVSIINICTDIRYTVIIMIFVEIIWQKLCISTISISINKS